jgi:hypothetical protein
MRNRLTERDLTRLIKRVINEKNEVEMPDPCKEQLKKLRNDPTYSQVIKKMKEYALLEWWEWYDKMNLHLTNGDHRVYVEYLKKEMEILKGCPSRYSGLGPTDRLGPGGSFERGY